MQYLVSGTHKLLPSKPQPTYYVTVDYEHDD